MADNDKQPTEQSADKPATTKAAAPAKKTSSASGKSAGSAPKAAATPASAPKQKSNALLWVVVLITLLLVIALGAAGYWFWYKKGDNSAQLAAQQEQQTTELARIEQENGQLQQQLAQLDRSRQELAGMVSQLADKTAQLQRQNQQTLSQLNNIEGRRPSDWLLAEADYLVRMAGRKVWLEQDLRTAVMLLENADSRLSELADPSVLPIRELIAKDIQALRQVNQVSSTSVALKLSALLAQVDKLALDTFEEPQTSESQALSDSVDDWQANLGRVWDNIVDDFISVSRTEKPIEPVMTQQEQWLNREQLKLQLMQAQSAAVGAQDELYKASLRHAIEQIAQNYDGEDAAVKGFSQTLEQLAQQDMSQELPDELGSAAPLQRLLEKRVEGVFGNQGAGGL